MHEVENLMRIQNKTLSRAWLMLILPVLGLACAISPTLSRPETAEPVVIAAPAATVAPLVLPAAAVDEQSTLISLYARANPAVVNLTIYVNQGGEMTPYSQGSGFLYDREGHFVTNAHVVQEADQIDVTFSDGSIVPGELRGLDLNSDLAVIQVEALPAGIEPLPMGSMEQLAVGQTVVAIGNPFGLDGTLTKGIISALGRDIPALNQFTIPLSIQTDAAINPGNSGGPLLDLQGHVIGVNAQIQTSDTSTANSGVGFAIPVSIVQRVVPDLIARGETEWAYLGVRGGDLTPTIVKAMSLPVERGAYLSQITPDGPAEAAGLRGAEDTQTVDGRTVLVGGDVITAIDGQQVQSFDDLLIYIALQTRPGQEVTLTIVRDGQTLEATLTLGTRPVTIG